MRGERWGLDVPRRCCHAVVAGSILEVSPIGVIVHNSRVGGSIREFGGGGGLSCTPPRSGIFASAMSPVYSAYGDSTVGGDLRISGLDT